MLGRKDLGPLLEIITSAENLDIRLAGLDAVTRFQLTADAWRAVGPALRRVLGETAQGLPERATAIELAARAPLTSVRSQLTALSDAADDPDAASARRVLHRPSSSDVEALLQRLENEPLDVSAAEELAALPIESIGYDASSQRALEKRLRTLAKDRTEDVRLWTLLTLARLGDNMALDQVLNGQGLDARIFGGSPWTAYDTLARLRPIPAAFHDHLLGWLERNPDSDRGAALLAWALTGSADAQGLPVKGPEESAQRAEESEQWQQAGLQAADDALGLGHFAGERDQGMTAEDPVERALASLLAGGPIYDSPVFWSLTPEQAVTVLVQAIRRITGEATGWEDKDAHWGDGIGNRLVEFTAMLPMPTDLPIRDIYHSLRSAIDDRQTAWILSRSPAPQLIAQFSQDLPTMEPPEQIDALQMLARAGDFQRGAPWPILGAGPGDAEPPVTPENLIDDLTPTPGQPVEAERDIPAPTTAQLPAQASQQDAGAAAPEQPGAASARPPRPHHAVYDDLVGSAFAALVKPGRLLFNPPDRMQFGQTERVEVRLARTPGLNAELLENLRGHGEPQVEEIQTAPLMAVTLKGDGFRITAYSDEEQSVTQEEITTWEFDIQALKRGPQRLVMCVSLRIPVPDRPAEHRSIPVREATIDVQVGAPALVAHFVAGNWQWFIGTAIAIAAVVVAVLSH